MSQLVVSPRRRGTDLLLAHMSGPTPRPPAAMRLRAELGGELSERLLAELLRGQRDERRRGSSSP
jgi:hypothetical protein